MKEFTISLNKFSKNEELVIKAMKDLDFARSVTVIAKKSGVGRTTTHYILRRLHKIGLVQKLPAYSIRKKDLGTRSVWLYKQRKMGLMAPHLKD